MHRLVAKTSSAILLTACWAEVSLATANTEVLNGAHQAAPGGEVNGNKVVTGPTSLNGTNGFFHTAANVLIYLTGAIAVIVLIIGGLRYVTSQGDSASVKSAKDTILYGVVGVVVAVLAYAIVNFVITALTK